jgi:hypothetical protein
VLGGGNPEEREDSFNRLNMMKEKGKFALVQRMTLESERPEFRSQLQHFLALWHKSKLFNLLSLNFLICEMGKVIPVPAL